MHSWILGGLRPVIIKREGDWEAWISVNVRHQMRMLLVLRTYQGLRGAKPDPVAVYAGDNDRLAVNLVGKRLSNIDTLSIGVKLGMGCSCHVVGG